MYIDVYRGERTSAGDICSSTRPSSIQGSRNYTITILYHIIIHIYVYIYTYIHIRTYVRTYVHTYIHTYIHTYEGRPLSGEQLSLRK